jgi:hypothetical protein
VSAQSVAGRIRSQVTFDECRGMRATIPAEDGPAGAVVLGTVGTVTGLAFVLLWCSSRGIAFTKTLGLAVSVPTGWLLVLGGFSALTLAMAALVVLALHSREIIQIDGETIAIRTAISAMRRSGAEAAGVATSRTASRSSSSAKGRLGDSVSISPSRNPAG